MANPIYGGLESNIPDGTVLIIPYPLISALQDYKNAVDTHIFIMADSLNQKSIYVETDYDNIILIDPNKIVVNNEVKDRLVDHEDLVFYANLETKVIPRTKLAIGESFDSPVINSSIASLNGKSDGAKINFLQPIDTNENSLSGTKRFLILVGQTS